jgi:hypothetical protein
MTKKKKSKKGMSATGKSILKGLKEALAYANGPADKSRYRVHTPRKKDKENLAKEARRQSRMLRDDPQEQKILEEFDWLNADEADKMGWKC